MEPNQQTVQNNNPPVVEANNQPVTNPAPVENTAVQNEPKKKSSKTGIILGFVLLFLLAAGGIGFGVWAMMDGNAQKEQLNAKIDKLKKQNDELLEKLSNNEDDEKNIDETEGMSDADAPGFIYIGEWGLKIKMPDNWRDMVSSYDYSNDYPQAVDTLTIKEKSESPLALAMLSKYGEQACNDTIRGMCFNVNGENYAIDFNASCSEGFINYFMNKDIYSAL